MISLRTLAVVLCPGFLDDRNAWILLFMAFHLSIELSQRAIKAVTSLRSSSSGIKANTCDTPKDTSLSSGIGRGLCNKALQETPVDDRMYVYPPHLGPPGAVAQDVLVPQAKLLEAALDDVDALGNRRVDAVLLQGHLLDLRVSAAENL